MSQSTDSPATGPASSSHPVADGRARDGQLSDGRTGDGRAPRVGLSTLAIHAGEARQKPGDSITDPVFFASTYTFTSTDEVLDFLDEKSEREEYGRYGNPSEKTVERKLAALDGAEDALLFSTGMSAFVGLMMAKLSAGDEVVFFDECYRRSRDFCNEHLARFGVTTRQVRTGSFDQMEAAINERTKLLISESPTNPHLSCIDIARFADVGKKHGVETLIDATLATPYNLRPLEHGITYVQHSATKYLAGHNDLLAGVLAGSRAALEPVRKLRGIMGAINSPHNIYLLSRGLKTFELRMARHNENGQRVAEFLAGHPRVERVYYPGLATHPDHGNATKYMRGFGGLITFTITDPDWRAAASVIDAARIPRIAPSLGGAESLIEQPLVMSYWKCTPEERKTYGIADNMIRLSCGLENADDLIADLATALEA